jgi:hypothetical protein
MKCNCGKELTSGDMNGKCSECTQKETQPLFQTGWICPVCGRGNSPWSSSCPCKGFVNFEVTCRPIAQ